MVAGAAGGDQVRGGGWRSSSAAAKRGRGRAGESPSGSGAHPGDDDEDDEARGGTPATNRCPAEQRPEREERDGDGDCGVPGPIPASGRCSSARRMRRRHQLGSGRPEVAARCSARRRRTELAFLSRVRVPEGRGSRRGRSSTPGSPLIEQWEAGGARSRGEAAGTATAAMATVPSLSPQ